MPNETSRPAEEAAAGIGPNGYANWRAAIGGGDPHHGSEFLLYGDAAAIGSGGSAGPYELVNMVAGITAMQGSTQPPIALRAWIHLGQEHWVPRMDQTDDSRFHGGDMADEIAVLLALVVGRRLRAGDGCRIFSHRSDPGRPRSCLPVPVPPVPSYGRRRLPHVCREFQLNQALTLFETYPSLTAARAVRLVRAARAYRDAIWLGESQPELAWLLLVTALECGASETTGDAAEPLELLARAWPTLASKIDRVEDSILRREIAAEIAARHGPTTKFVKFVANHAPLAGPTPRPRYDAFDWDRRRTLKDAAGKIYEYRSWALHDGIPFPPPMCYPPRPPSETEGASEVPGGLASGTLGGAWMAEATPMLLQTFEYITRACLLSWWRDMVTPAPVAEAGGQEAEVTAEVGS